MGEQSASQRTTGASANLIIGAAGAGILSFPYAIMRAGVLLGSLACIIFAFLNYYALRILTKFAVFPTNSKYARDGHCPSSYYNLIGSRMGPTAARIANITIYIGISGALIGYLVIIADLTCPVIKQVLGDSSFFASRPFVTVFFVLCVALPLSTVPGLEGLVISSILAVLSVFVVVCAVIWRSVDKASNGALADEISYTTPPSWWSIFEAMPIMLFAFSCPLQAVAVAFELNTGFEGDAEQTDKSMKVATAITIILCGFMYLSVGLFGYIQFGPATVGIVLDNYGESDAMANVARVLMAAHVALAYPVVSYPAQHGVLEYIQDRITPKEKVDLTGIQPLLIGSETNSNARQHEFPIHAVFPLSWRVWSAVIIGGMTTLIAILLPQVEIVFG